MKALSNPHHNDADCLKSDNKWLRYSKIRSKLLNIGMKIIHIFSLSRFEKIEKVY